MALAALIVMRLIAGPANADRLARSAAHQLAWLSITALWPSGDGKPWVAQRGPLFWVRL